jgi:hypothetical protein
MICAFMLAALQVRQSPPELLLALELALVEAIDVEVAPVLVALLELAPPLPPAPPAPEDAAVELPRPGDPRV